MELFELYLAPGETSNQFKVTVSQSPVGEGSVESLLPFFEEGHDWRTTLLKTIESTTFNPDNFQIPNEQAWMVNAGILTADRQTLQSNWLKTVGRSLYQALFPQDSVVKQLLQSALSFAESRSTQLHVRLRFDANSMRRSRLADYPWELIHDGQWFLAQHQVTFSRYIAHDTVPPNLLPSEQLTVLLVSSTASDADQGLKPISITEQQAIRQGLKKATQTGAIHLIQLERPTQNSLRAYLIDHTENVYPHVLHFDGHGLFGKRCKNEQCRAIHKGIKVERCRICGTPLPDAQGYLVFEREEGGPDYVSATELGTLLQQTSFADSTHSSRGIALTVLSACQSGMSVVGDSLFNGMAQNLIGHRVPAVVAMQYSVSVQSAAQFAEQFYRSLGQKNSLAIAVSQGREAMGAEGNQWHRPVLYLRWRDNGGGQLFAPNHLPVHSRLKLQRVLTTSLLITAAIFGLRFAKVLEWAELKTFDHLMQLRLLNDGTDGRLVVVQVTDEDLEDQIERKEKKGPGTLTEHSLNQLLKKLEKLRPKLIGYDFYRDFEADRNESGLVDRLRQKKLFMVCKVPETDSQGQVRGREIPPPKEVSPEQIGFSDFVQDSDQTVRRYLMTQPEVPGASCNTRQSLSLLLARRYLELETGGNSQYIDPFKTGKNLQLAGATFEPLQFFWGGYQDVSLGGYQVMLNYRATGPNPKDVAKLVTLKQVLNDQVLPDDFENTIVLIGLTATIAANDSWETPYGTLPGVIVQAHMISQVLDIASGARSPLKVWAQGIELLWIWGWAVAGGLLVYIVRSPLRQGAAGGTALLVLYVICLCTLTWSNLWLPLFPSALAFILTGAGILPTVIRLANTSTPKAEKHELG